MTKLRIREVRACGLVLARPSDPEKAAPSDPLAPARGILNVILVGVVFWLVIAVAYVLLAGSALATTAPASCVIRSVPPVVAQNDGSGVKMGGQVRGYCPAAWLAKTEFLFAPEYARADRWHVLGVHYTSGPAGRINYAERDDDYQGCGYWRLRVTLTTSTDRLRALGPVTEFCT